MNLSRSTVAITLSSALLLSACSGGDQSADPTTSAPAGTATSTSGDAAATATADEGATSTPDGEAATATGQSADDAAATSAGPGTDDAASTTVAMTSDEAEAVLSLEEAEEVARTILTRRFEADQGDGRDVRDLQRKSMMGNVRKAHEAADALESVTGEPAEMNLDEEPVEANVLAISRDDGELPMFLLVQTVPEDGLPILHLLESRTGETEHFRISWEAPMLPGTEVPTFDRRSVGSPVLRSGQGELETDPRVLLKQVANLVTYPRPDDLPEIRTHGYAPSVRRSAEAQAEALQGQATLREKNWLVSDDVKTLLFEDGTAFVMGTLLRDTRFEVDPESRLTPSDSFRVFQDSAALAEEAVLRTSVFVGMHAPTEDDPFPPEMIAVREQLVDAWGS